MANHPEYPLPIHVMQALLALSAAGSHLFDRIAEHEDILNPALVQQAEEVERYISSLLNIAGDECRESRV